MNKEKVSPDPGEKSSGPEEKGDSVNILLVDDQASNLDALESILSSPDYRIVRAQTANEALLALLQADFAAIVLDMKMPDVSGIDLAMMIKERKRTRHIPILFLTAHMLDERDVLRGYGVGAADYLSKPVNPEILKSKIAVFIDLFRKTRALAAANHALEVEVEERQRAQEALRKANEELEARVEERTADLTRLNDCLRQSEEALREEDCRKNEFLATLAHELRNPLAPIRNSLEIMRLKEGDMAVMAQARSIMGRQLSQMVRLIDDLLDVSRITSGRIQLRRERVELSQVLQNALETSKPLIAEAGHELIVALPPERIVLDADGTRLAQVFSNLLNNAAKYSEKRGRIQLVAGREDDRIAVKVKDTGIGISREMLPKVFDMFVQADRRIERTQGGLGIGLTLVRRLVELHGGTVEARSEGPGTGSEFTVRLPILTPQPLPSKEESARPRAASVMGSSRIVIADDNQDAARSLAQVLEHEGNEIRLAHDGMEALEVAESYRPDIVILDIGMPKLNGYEVARRIREKPWSKRVLLVALTGWGQDEDQRRASEAGFDRHLIKPVDPGIVHEIVIESRTRAHATDKQ